MSDSIKVDGVHFMKGTLNGKTKDEFKKHEEHHGLSDESLEEAYDRLNKFEPGYVASVVKEITGAAKNKELSAGENSKDTGK